MNRIKKTVVCLALCMVMLLGSSLTSFAASGTNTYSKYSVSYSTSSTKITMTARNTGDAYYQLSGYACVKKTSGTTIDRQSLLAGNGGIGLQKTASFTLSEQPWSKYSFSNAYSSYNKMNLKRSTDLTKGFTTIWSFSYKI